MQPRLLHFKADVVSRGGGSGQGSGRRAGFFAQ